MKVLTRTDVDPDDEYIVDGETVSVDEFLSNLQPGTDTADGFLDRARKAASGKVRRKSWQSEDPLQITKASKQLKRKEKGLEGRIVPPPFDVWEASSMLTRNVWHGRCVELKATVASGLKWSIEDDDGEDARGQAPQALLDLLKNPNDRHEEINDIAKCVFFDLEALGFAFIEVDRRGNAGDATQPIEALYHVPAATVRISANSDVPGFWQIAKSNTSGEHPGVFFKQFRDQEQRSIHDGRPVSESRSAIPDDSANELIMLAVYHPLGGAYGIPSWLPAALSMRLDWAAHQYNSDFFEHQTIPNKIIIFKGLTPSAEEVRHLEDYFEVGLKGRNHKPLVLAIDPEDMTKMDEEGGEVDIEIKDLKLGTGGKIDADFTNLSGLSRDEIVTAHGVPPSMLGVQSPGRLGGKGDNETNRRDFKSFKIEPLQTGFERVFAKTVFQEFDVADLVLRLTDFDLSDHEFTLSKAREMRASVGAGVRTINEARREMGLPELDMPVANELFVLTSSGPFLLRWVSMDGPPQNQGRPVQADPPNGNGTIEERLETIEQSMNTLANLISANGAKA